MLRLRAVSAERATADLFDAGSASNAMKVLPVAL
jgi:hypothetical protein